MPDTIPNLHQWERGPKITAIGGGQGCPPCCGD